MASLLYIENNLREEHLDGFIILKKLILQSKTLKIICSKHTYNIYITLNDNNVDLLLAENLHRSVCLYKGQYTLLLIMILHATYDIKTLNELYNKTITKELLYIRDDIFSEYMFDMPCEVSCVKMSLTYINDKNDIMFEINYTDDVSEKKCHKSYHYYIKYMFDYKTEHNKVYEIYRKISHFKIINV